MGAVCEISLRTQKKYLYSAEVIMKFLFPFMFLVLIHILHARSGINEETSKNGIEDIANKGIEDYKPFSCEDLCIRKKKNCLSSAADIEKHFKCLVKADRCITKCSQSF